MTVSLLLRILSSSGRLKNKKSSLHKNNELILLIILSLFSLINTTIQSSSPSTNHDHHHHHFPDDLLTPYPQGKHGGTRTSRDISECIHTKWENRTIEIIKTPVRPPSRLQVKYETHKFADIVHRTPLRKRYAIGTITTVNNPYYTLSILEPKHKGTCEGDRTYYVRATVQDTVTNRKQGCCLAANAGYFTVATGNCLGNIVSNGRLVQSAEGVQNANFGIRQDGTIVVGYISEEDLYDTVNPFRQLISGVVWLVRNGTNYVNESKDMECSEHEDTGKMDTFVNVLSARSAIGHDSDGRVVLARIEGQTHQRGANLYEFADILISKGVVNAINLDGGGSNTLVEDGLLMNYPSDHCRYSPKYRCPRQVSTILCVHDVECLEPTCSSHGSCDFGQCSCDSPWMGVACEELNCTLTNCSGHGTCSDESLSCECDPGWYGELCEKPCPSNKYGSGCKSYCYCYGHGHCHPVFGNCTCSDGYHGKYCWNKCSKGYYGQNCIHRCKYPECSGHGECSIYNGQCNCHEGWTGISCNDTVSEYMEQSSSLLLSSDLSSSSSYMYIDMYSTSSNFILSSSSPLEYTATATGTTSACINNISTTTSLLQPSPTTTTSDIPSTNSLQHSRVTSIVIFTGVITVIIHLLLCTLHILCCSNKGGGGMMDGNSKGEIKRHLMERSSVARLIFLIVHRK